MSSERQRGLLLGLCLLAALDAQAGVTAERTRVIFNEGQREASLLLVNQNAYPVIVQTWIDDGNLDTAPETAQAPIMPLPPVFRLNPEQQRSLRLLYTGQALPKDRESLYWLNLYEIPPKSRDPLAEGQSRLTVTLRTQMKVIYRPAALQADAEGAPARLRFSSVAGELRVENPTPYFITLASVDVPQGQRHTIVQGELLEPFARRTLTFAQPVPEGKTLIHYQWIDDGGNAQAGESTLR